MSVSGVRVWSAVTLDYKKINQQNLARRNTIAQIQRKQKLPKNKFGHLIASMQYGGQQEVQLRKANTSKKIQQSSLIKGHYNKRQTPTV